MNHKTSNEQFNSTIMILMRKRKLFKKDIKDAIGITYETLEKKFKHPQLFNGYERNAIAEVLKVNIDTVDDMINGNLSKETAMTIK